MKDRLIIIGAGGHGKVVADIATKMNKWKSISFLDDSDSITECLGFKVIGRTKDTVKFKEHADFIVAIGNNKTRESVQEYLIFEGYSIATLIHPSAIIGIDVDIGVGSVVMAGVVINSSTRVGKGCILNTSSSIDHDNIIEDYVHLSPGVRLAGTVNVGRGSWLGIGSVVSNNVNICSNCTIGSGGVVIKSISGNGGTYVGVPVRKLDVN